MSPGAAPSLGHRQERTSRAPHHLTRIRPRPGGPGPRAGPSLIKIGKVFYFFILLIEFLGFL